MTDETTTEQLAEIEGQTEDTPAAQYTPPEGWRLLAVGELVMLDDQWVRQDGSVWRSMGTEGPVPEGARYIRRIEPQPETEPAVQNGLVRDVTHLLQESGVLDFAKAEQQIEELRSEVSYVQNLLGESRQRVRQLEELVASLQTINEALEKAFTAENKENDALRLQVQNRQQEYERQRGRIEFLETLDAGNAVAICDYKAKVEKLQGLVDRARGQLETAATEHDSLSTQLAAVKAELVTQAETSRRLQIELDAAQQVPADSPELRQLRLDLAEVTLDRDQYKDAYTRLSAFVETIRETAKAEAVEAIVEWLEPVRATIEAADNVQQTMRADNLACDIIWNLPGILRYVVGLNHPEEIE